MGAVTFSLDPNLVAALQSELPLSIFVETGTFEGDTLNDIYDDFDVLYSVELSPKYYQAAVQRFSGRSRVQLLKGSSPMVLNDLCPRLHGKDVLYFLDAHWCKASGTAGEFSQCPLLDELKAIGSCGDHSVIVIDDARLFLAPPLAPHEISGWPSFHQVLTSLYAMSEKHQLMVVNDTLVFFPTSAVAVMQNYAQNFGIDWLKASSAVKRNWEAECHEKEESINKLNDSLYIQKEALLEASTDIQVLHNALKAYRLAYGRFSPLKFPARLIRRLLEVIQPRLGNLNQYSPRKLQLNSGVKNKNIIEYPLVSIVTPSYSQGAYIERTLLSILGQDYPNLEYYVQDGGSCDNTVDVLTKYQCKITGWESRGDNGQSEAINLGFLKSNGEIMGWINSDDLLLPGALEEIIHYFNNHPEIDVVYGNRLLIDENDLEIGRWILPGHSDETLSWADYVPQETLFWRRGIWEKAGGRIDESFRFAMDWDLLIRFRSVGAKFAHIPKFLGAFRIHDCQKTSSLIEKIGIQEMDRIRYRCLGRSPTKNEIHQAVLPYLMKHLIVDLIYRIRIRIGK